MQDLSQNPGENPYERNKKSTSLLVQCSCERQQRTKSRHDARTSKKGEVGRGEEKVFKEWHTFKNLWVCSTAEKERSRKVDSCAYFMRISCVRARRTSPEACLLSWSDRSACSWRPNIWRKQHSTVSVPTRSTEEEDKDRRKMNHKECINVINLQTRVE